MADVLQEMRLAFNPFEPTATGAPLRSPLAPPAKLEREVLELLDAHQDKLGAKVLLVVGEYGSGKTCLLQWLHRTILGPRGIKSFLFHDPGVHFYGLADTLLRAGLGGGCPLLRQVDAGRGAEADRPPVSEGVHFRRKVPRAPGTEEVRGSGADGDRVAVGADGAEPEPGVRGCGGAAGVVVLAVAEDGTGGVGPTGGGGSRVAVRSSERSAGGSGGGGKGTKLSRGSNFRCLVSGTPIGPDWIKTEGKAGRMGAQLMAVVAEGDRERVYLNATSKHDTATATAIPDWGPDQEMPNDRRWFSPPIYGMATYSDLFTPRQLVALTTFSDLVGEARDRIVRDAKVAGMPDDGKALRDRGRGATGYGDAVGAYLGLAVSRLANFSSSLASWNTTAQGVRQTFGRQALPMVWDFCESSPFSSSSGNWLGLLRDPVKLLEHLPTTTTCRGAVSQHDAQQQTLSSGKVVSTDPPYYDNIGYADLSDFFYLWLRRSLASQFPELFLSMTVPKAEELVATPHRHGGKTEAERFFLAGMVQAMRRLALESHPGYPVTIYYAFKQSETTAGGGMSSTGWETFLEAVIKVGFSITGTWPMRTERPNRLTGLRQQRTRLVHRSRLSQTPQQSQRDHSS